MKQRTGCTDSPGNKRTPLAAHTGATARYDLAKTIHDACTGRAEENRRGDVRALSLLCAAGLLAGCGSLATAPRGEQGKVVALSPVAVTVQRVPVKGDSDPEPLPQHENPAAYHRTGTGRLELELDETLDVGPLAPGSNEPDEPGPATATRVAAVQSSPTMLIETEVVGLRIDGRRAWQKLKIDDFDVLLRSDGTRLLAVLRTLRALDIDVETIGERHSFHLDGGRRVTIDTRAGIALVNDRTLPLDLTTGVSDITGRIEIYLPAHQIQAMLPIDFDWDDANYEYRGTTRHAFRVWERSPTSRRRSLFGDAEFIEDELPWNPEVAHPDRSGLSLLEARVAMLSATDSVTGDTRLLVQGHPTLWGHVGSGEYRVSLANLEHDFGNSDADFQRPWGDRFVPRRAEMRFGRANSELVLGDSSFGVHDLAFPIANITGVRFNGITGVSEQELRGDRSSLGLHRRFYRPYTFEGLAPVGSDVRLELNGTIIDEQEILEEFDPITGLGRYRFEDVSISNRSLSNIVVVIREPNGVESEITTDVVAAPMQLAPGSFAYVGGVGTRRSSVEWDTTGVVGVGRVLYGLSENFTLGASLVTQEEVFGFDLGTGIAGERGYPTSSHHGAFEVSGQILSNLVLSGDVGFSMGEGPGLDDVYDGDAMRVAADFFPLAGARLRAQAFRYSPGFFDGRNLSLENKQGFHLYGVWQPSQRWALRGAAGMVSEIDTRLGQRKLETDFSQLELSAMLFGSSRWQFGVVQYSPSWEEKKLFKTVRGQSALGRGLRLRLDLSLGDDLDFQRNREFLQGLSLPGLRRFGSRDRSLLLEKRLSNRTGVGIEYRDSFNTEEVLAVHNYERAKLRLSSKLGYDFDRGKPVWEGWWDYRLPGDNRNRISLVTRHERGEWRVDLGIFASALFDTARGRPVRISSRGFNPERGGVRGKVFVDLNGNGVLDNDEPGVPEVRIRSRNFMNVETDADGNYMLPMMGANDSTQVALDIDTVPATYSIIHGQQKAAVGSGGVTRVNFAVAPMVTVSGSILVHPIDLNNIDPELLARPDSAELIAQLIASSEEAAPTEPSTPLEVVADEADAPRELSEQVESPTPQVLADAEMVTQDEPAPPLATSASVAREPDAGGSLIERAMAKARRAAPDTMPATPTSAPPSVAATPALPADRNVAPSVAMTPQPREAADGPNYMIAEDLDAVVPRSPEAVAGRAPQSVDEAPAQPVAEPVSAHAAPGPRPMISEDLGATRTVAAVDSAQAGSPRNDVEPESVVAPVLAQEDAPLVLEDAPQEAALLATASNTPTESIGSSEALSEAIAEPPTGATSTTGPAEVAPAADGPRFMIADDLDASTAPVPAPTTPPAAVASSVLETEAEAATGESEPVLAAQVERVNEPTPVEEPPPEISEPVGVLASRQADAVDERIEEISDEPVLAEAPVPNPTAAQPVAESEAPILATTQAIDATPSTPTDEPAPEPLAAEAAGGPRLMITDDLDATRQVAATAPAPASLDDEPPQQNEVADVVDPILAVLASRQVPSEPEPVVERALSETPASDEPVDAPPVTANAEAAPGPQMMINEDLDTTEPVPAAAEEPPTPQVAEAAEGPRFMIADDLGASRPVTPAPPAVEIAEVAEAAGTSSPDATAIVTPAPDDDPAGVLASRHASIAEAGAATEEAALEVEAEVVAEAEISADADAGTDNEEIPLAAEAAPGPQRMIVEDLDATRVIVADVSRPAGRESDTESTSEPRDTPTPTPPAEIAEAAPVAVLASREAATDPTADADGEAPQISNDAGLLSDAAGIDGTMNAELHEEPLVEVDAAPANDAADTDVNSIAIAASTPDESASRPAATDESRWTLIEDDATPDVMAAENAPDESIIAGADSEPLLAEAAPGPRMMITDDLGATRDIPAVETADAAIPEDDVAEQEVARESVEEPQPPQILATTESPAPPELPITVPATEAADGPRMMIEDDLGPTRAAASSVAPAEVEPVMPATTVAGESAAGPRPMIDEDLDAVYPTQQRTASVTAAADETEAVSEAPAGDAVDDASFSMAGTVETANAAQPEPVVLVDTRSAGGMRWDRSLELDPPPQVTPPRRQEPPVVVELKSAYRLSSGPAQRMLDEYNALLAATPTPAETPTIEVAPTIEPAPAYEQATAIAEVPVVAEEPDPATTEPNPGSSGPRLAGMSTTLSRSQDRAPVEPAREPEPIVLQRAQRLATQPASDPVQNEPESLNAEQRRPGGMSISTSLQAASRAAALRNKAIAQNGVGNRHPVALRRANRLEQAPAEARVAEAPTTRTPGGMQLSSRINSRRPTAIAGVRVVIRDDQDRIVVDSITASDGSFYFGDLRPGKYKLDVDRDTIPRGYVMLEMSKEINVESVGDYTEITLPPIYVAIVDP